ncbi:uncharacterized protein LOC131649136 isoform X2 [Vicia villosa]|nr:uncharacterized protein LOC131649136 isoform X2 [Vicia villosa]
MEMEIPRHRTWMYNRLLPGRSGHTYEFLKGVEEFITFACQQREYLKDGVIRCPCKKCKNEDHLTPDEANIHIHKHGFTPEYWNWTCHGEIIPHINDSNNDDIDMVAPCSSSSQQWSYEHVHRYQDMVFDAAGFNREQHFAQHEEEPPNMEAKKFYDMLNSTQQPLWSGCKNTTELSASIKMLNLKSKHNMSQACFDDMVKFMKESSHPENVIPSNFRETKKLVARLGLSRIKIDCCIGGCMLYYKEDINLKECKFCNEPRYKTCILRKRKRNSKDVPRKRLHYLPLIPRLQRLYASERSAKHMRWHYENRREEGVLCHPSDGEAWKHFDQVYPAFASEPRNVRLGLCADGFTPFSQSAKPYSCWPVIVTPYNLPPELCMMMPYMYLTLIIPGPDNPKGKIDVYLQPLIDELQQLWNDGVVTYDSSKRQNFRLRAALIWTINDFPAYGMLSGWSTSGIFACPVCKGSLKAFSLKKGRKRSWFDCHRRFLPHDHAFRRNKVAFYKNRIETREPPPRLSGEQVWKKVSGLPKVTNTRKCIVDGRGISHNWTKRSIFWDLPYWRHNLLRHNLDVMHIEKNVFENVFHTVMNNKEKTKDNENARLDLEKYCHRKELLLKKKPNGNYMKPKAKYCLTNEQKIDVCEWVKGLKMPDGYASNLGRCVDSKQKKLFGMKSHDCHIFMECLLPIAFSALPEPIWKTLTELSQFFRDLCSTVL